MKANKEEEENDFTENWKKIMIAKGRRMSKGVERQ